MFTKKSREPEDSSRLDRIYAFDAGMLATIMDALSIPVDPTSPNVYRVRVDNFLTEFQQCDSELVITSILEDIVIPQAARFGVLEELNSIASTAPFGKLSLRDHGDGTLRAVCSHVEDFRAGVSFYQLANVISTVGPDCQAVLEALLSIMKEHHNDHT